MTGYASESGEWPRDLRRGLGIQRRVVIGLMIRQLMTKYGRDNIGFLWIILEPMILCAGVLVVRSVIQHGEENGISLIGLIWTGYIPLTLWRHISNAGVRLLRRSAGLLYHRDISLFDCFYAVIGIELGGCTLAGLIVYWVLYTFDLIVPVDDLGLMLYGWFTMAVISIGMMALFAVLTEYWEPAEHFIQPFQYLTLPLCGFMFMVNWLPDPVQKIALWMPTVSSFEMIRAGLFGPIVITYYSWWYPLVCGLVMLAIALPMVEPARGKIHFG